MPSNAPLSDEVIAEIIRLRREENASAREIGRRLGIHHTTVCKMIKRYRPDGTAGDPIATDGAPPKQKVDQVIDRTDLDGSIDVLKMDRPASPQELMRLCQLDPMRWIPQVYRGNCWQGFYKVKTDEGHRKVNLYQSRLVCKRVITEELESAILELVRELVPAKKAPKRVRRKVSKDAQMLVWGLWDAHLGMYAWHGETRADWDVDIAVNTIYNSIDDIRAEMRPYEIGKVVIPIGNDFLHFDSVRNTTSMGDHHLDTDTRFARVYLAGLKCLIYMVEQALEMADDVRLVYVPGNHDYSVSFTLIAALAQRFFKDERVTVDLSANPRKYITHGGTLIGFDHGKFKPERLMMNMATEAKEAWGDSTYREIQIGHKHQKRETMFKGVVPTNGCLVRMNPSLCNADFWHHSLGFTDPVKTCEAYRYDAEGFRGSHVASARPDFNPHRKVTEVAHKVTWDEA